MKKRWMALVLLLTFLLNACGTAGDGGGSTQQDDSDTNEKTEDEMDIVKDHGTDYVISVDYADKTAVEFAEALQNAVVLKTGVLVPKRSVAQTDEAAKRILVSTKNEPVPENGFSVSIGQLGLELSAHDFLGYYRMERFCEDVLLAGAKQGEWKISSLDIENGGVGIADESIRINPNGTEIWYLVYDSDNTEMRAIANGTAAYLMSQCGLTIKTASDNSEYEHEIRFGSVARKTTQAIKKYMKDESDVFFGVLDESYTILFENRLGLAFGVMNLAEKLKAASGNGVVELKSSDSRSLSLASLPKDDAYAEAVLAANTICGTWSTWVDRTIDKLTDVKKDQALVEALIRRMGNAFAVSVGSTSVLWQGYIQVTDVNDYSKKTKYSVDGHILIAQDFANRYFQETLPADADGYVDLSAFCRNSTAYVMDFDSETGIAVVSPVGVERFDSPKTVVDGYSNAAYLARMAEFFDGRQIPAPDCNVEQTRTVVDSLDFETRYIFDYTTHSYQTYYSPAILARVEAGVTVTYAAYEVSTVLGGQEIETITYLKRSSDGEKSWELLGEVPELRWASLFEHAGKIWLLGNHRESGTVLISSFNPTDRVQKISDIGMKKAGGGAPNTVTVTNGRVYKAMNNGVISARADSDLTVGANWTVSNDPQALISRETFDRLAGEKSNPNNIFRFEEGNVIPAPDGGLCVLYRIDAAPTVGHAALFRLSEDGKTLSVDSQTGGVIDFPYSQSKFSIRYDEATGTYLSLTSLSTMNSVFQRNVLGLAVSKDLIHWEVAGVLLSDREMMNPTVSMYAHAFQYVDFVMADGDLLFIVREAVGDTIRFHDANNVTVYRLKDYETMIEKMKSKGEPQ